MSWPWERGCTDESCWAWRSDARHGSFVVLGIWLVGQRGVLDGDIFVHESHSTRGCSVILENHSQLYLWEGRSLTFKKWRHLYRVGHSRVNCSASGDPRCPKLPRIRCGQWESRVEHLWLGIPWLMTSQASRPAEPQRLATRSHVHAYVHTLVPSNFCDCAVLFGCLP